jgi:glycosyltransferase involved in cell wall biosynthesis
MSLRRLAIITTHPIQYNAPVFKMLHERGNIEIRVFYTWSQSANGELYDPGFKKNITWDLPLLQGYPFTFVNNVSTDPGSHRFSGIDNPTLKAEVTEYEPDAIMVYSWNFKSHLQAMRHFKGRVPILFRGDSTLLDESAGIKKIIRTLWLKWVYSKVDKPLFVGDHNKSYYLRHGKKENDLAFVPHAIDNKRFVENSAHHQAEALSWRRQLGIADTETVFLFAGKLEPKKDPALLIQAFSEVQSDGMHLVMVGNGEEEQSLKKTFSSVKNLHFIDFQNQSNMPVVYYMTDVFVLPSKGPRETWGLAMNEAMACSRPVLASDRCGGAINLVKQGVNGYIFRSGDKEDLKEKMTKFTSIKHQLGQMGRHSFEIVQEYSFENICNRIENIVRHI